MTHDHDIGSQIARLRATLEAHNHAYHVLDRPTVPDAEYDRLFRTLAELEAQHPEFDDPNSPTRRIGATPCAEFRKAIHRVPMLSLENAMSAEEFQAWVSRVRRHLGDRAPEALAFHVEPKIDGISISLTYEDGVLTRAATRGDGETGEDVTDNVRTIRTLPLRLAAPSGVALPKRLEIRGEVYVTKTDFDAFNARLPEGEEPYRNPRNFAGGSLRQLDSRISAGRPLRIALYALAEADGLALPSQSELLEWLRRVELPVADPLNAICATPEDVAARWQSVNRDRDAVPYEIDGIVVKVDSFTIQAELGMRSRTPRWAIAWKFAARAGETTLRGIDVSVGRTGVLTPVAVLDAVDIGGVTVTSATLHNQEEMDRLGIAIGDRVLVARAGDVIPKILRVVEASGRGVRPFRIPPTCPICGTDAVRDEEEVAIRCPNPRCPAQVKARVRHFASKDALDIDGLGEKLVEQIVDNGLVTTPADLFTLDLTTLAALDRMGEKSARNLVTAIDAARRRPLHRFLFGLGIRHVGEVVAARIAEVAGTLTNLRAMDEDHIAAIEEVGSTIAPIVRAWFLDPTNQAMLDRMTKLGVAPLAAERRASTGQLAGMTAVVTGTLPTLDRRAAEGLLKDHGAKIGSSVSKATTFLLAGEKAGSKLAKATELGVPVLDEATVVAWLAGSPRPF